MILQYNHIKMYNIKLKDVSGNWKHFFSVPKATFEWILKAGKLQQDDKLSIEVKDYEAAWFKK